MKAYPLKVGDKVELRSDVLQRHARSVPAHLGYTHEQFQWRDTLRKLEGAPGTVSRLFPDSKHVNVDFGETTIGIDNTELVRAMSVVVFRVDKEDNVFALFPEDPADIAGTLCTCYEHTGQHGSADYHGCIKFSRSAKPEEYADLAEELRGIGYNLVIRRRATYANHRVRQETLRKMEEATA